MTSDHQIPRAVVQYLAVLTGRDIQVGLGGMHDTKEGGRLVSYRNDFGALWDWLSDPLSPAVPLLLILWDGTPPLDQTTEGIDITRYLTPLDWVVADALAACDGATERKAHRVAILLANDPNRLQTDAVRWFARHPDWRLPELPWVRALQVPGLVGEADLPRLDRIGEIFGEELPDAGARTPDLGLLRRVWCLNLTAPINAGDHHAITNLVGPLAILGAEHATGSDWLRALAILMQRLGLVPKCSAGDVGAAQPWVVWDEPSFADRLSRLGNQNLQLVLLDDQAHLGWAQVLGKMIGVRLETPLQSYGETRINGDASVTIRACAATEPNWLLDKLEYMDGKEARYVFRLTDADPQPAEILFLDLRLFPGASAIREAEFILRLTKLAESFVCTADDFLCSERDRSRHFPWPGFHRTELDAAKAWAEAVLAMGKRPDGPESEAYLHALTFLPRLLALTDCSLPIVLFSSTGRREVIDTLAPYGNVFTQFEKPRLFGSLTSTFIDEIRDDFRKATLEALSLCVTRERLACLVKLQCDPSFTTKKMNGKRFRIEIFLDEQGDISDRRFSVGGLLSVKNITTENRDINRKIRAFMQAHNLSVNKHSLRNNRETLAQQLLESSTDSDVRIAAIKLTGSTRDCVTFHNATASPLEDIAVADNLYRELFRCVVESAVYTLARHWIPDDSEQTLLDVKVGTRVVPVSDYANLINLPEEDVRKNFFWHWGMLAEHIPGIRNTDPFWGHAWVACTALKKLSNANGDLEKMEIFRTAQNFIEKLSPQNEPPLAFRHVNYDTPRPLVDEIMRQYRQSAFSPRVEHVRGENINNSSAMQKASILHLLADAVLCDANNLDQSSQELFQIGFASYFDSSLLTLLQAQRFLQCGSFVEALIAATEIEHPKKQDALHCLIWGDLCDVALRLPGIEVIRFARSYVSSISEDRLGVEESLIGEFVRKTTNKYIFRSNEKEFELPEWKLLPYPLSVQPWRNYRLTKVRTRIPGQERYRVDKMPGSSAILPDCFQATVIGDYRKQNCTEGNVRISVDVGYIDIPANRITCTTLINGARYEFTLRDNCYVFTQLAP
jgi:hypothetical protein